MEIIPFSLLDFRSEVSFCSHLIHLLKTQKRETGSQHTCWEDMQQRSVPTHAAHKPPTSSVTSHMTRSNGQHYE